MKCPNCGTDNAPGEQFCTNCGFYLDPSNANAPTIVASAPGTGNSGGISNTTTSTIIAGPGGNSRSLAPNAHLQNGRYVIEKVLGQGGMGAALLAKDTRVSNKLVVIKELISDNTDQIKRQEDVRNFEREVETLAHIDHPLVPNVTDSFQEGARYFMVQEYVAGENLEDRMERINQPMPEREALAYASQVLDVLDYLEQQTPPIVHRDIKPANIIVGSKDKRAHLVDFGIARVDVAKNAQRKQTSALGTPGYAPPEQYQGNADARSDLYALAATLHHLLTNRDPRNFAPFSYPPARSINSQLSPDIEGILSHELTIDVNKRYQTAAEFKQDIDEILAKRFNVSGDTSTYTLGMSGPMGNTRTQLATSSPLPPQPPAKPSPARPAPAKPLPPPIPISTAAPQSSSSHQQQRQQRLQSQGGGFSAPPVPQSKPRNNNGYIAMSLGLLILVVLIIGGVIFVLPSLNKTQTSGGSTPVATQPPLGSPISTTLVNGEAIGLSDGSVAFDTNRPDGDLMTQAATKFAQGDVTGADTLWTQAIQLEPNDAEALIYHEDHSVVSSGNKFITLVVATMLTGTNVGVGRDDLQGAYVAQKEFNDGAKITDGSQIRLVIANGGSKSSDNATTVASRIVQLAQSDSTVVGVMGWPYSGYTLKSYQILANAKIPLVSPTASSTALTGVSPYFFRVCPADDLQGVAGATYAFTGLKARNAVVFQDTSDPYSSGLARQFSQEFVKDGGKVVKTENYKEGPTGQATLANNLLTDALSNHPDLIYFAGYAADLSPMLTNLPSSASNIPVLGGDALYELNSYSTSARAKFGQLRFTSFFYPDEWSVVGLASQKPIFFTEYPANFDPQNKHAGEYGYARPSNDNALSYDATLALLNAYNHAKPTGANSTVTPNDLKNALAGLSFQGASGAITFGTNGNATNKAVVVLQFDTNQHIQFVSLEGNLVQAS